jgi:hypothetical protein
VEAEQPAALVLTIKTLTEQRITPDTPVVAVRMQELAKVRELVVPLTRAAVAVEGLPRVAVAAAALAVSVNQDLVLPMAVSGYLATSRALRFFMAAAVEDLLTYQRSALAVTAVVAVAALAPEASALMAFQARTVLAVAVAVAELVAVADLVVLALSL